MDSPQQGGPGLVVEDDDDAGVRQSLERVLQRLASGVFVGFVTGFVGGF